MDKQIQKAEKKVKKLNRELSALLLAFITTFETDKGRILFNSGNLSKVSKVDEVYREFNNDYQRDFLFSLITMLRGRDRLIREYYTSLGLSVKKQKEIGVLSENMRRYMVDFSKGEQLTMTIKSRLTASIAAKEKLTVLTKEINKQVSSELQKFYQRNLFEAMMQYERINRNLYAEKLGLNYFIYKGGIIETSRIFCIEKNDKIFHRDDAEDWKIDPNLPAMGQGVYEPLVDLGRWNCRHFLLWITDEKAEEYKYGKDKKRG